MKLALATETLSQNNEGSGPENKPRKTASSHLLLSFHLAFPFDVYTGDKTYLLSSIDEAVLANLEEATMCNKSAGTCIGLVSIFLKVFKEGGPESISL